MKRGFRSSKRLMQKHMETMMPSDGATQGMLESAMIAFAVLSCDQGSTGRPDWWCFDTIAYQGHHEQRSILARGTTSNQH